MNAPEVSLFVTPAERWEKVLELRDRFCEAKQDDDMIAGMTVADFLLDFIADSREPIRGALAERDTLLAHVPARAVAALRTERGG